MAPQPEHFWPCPNVGAFEPGKVHFWAVSVPNNFVCPASRIWFASQMFYFFKDPALELGHGNMWLQKRTMSKILSLPAGNQM